MSTYHKRGEEQKEEEEDDCEENDDSSSSGGSNKRTSGVSVAAPGQDGACVQCSAGRCLETFHVTCARAANLLVQIQDWPRPIYLACRRHCTPRHGPGPGRSRLNARHGTTPLQPNSGEQPGCCRPKLEVGEHVYGRYRDGRYYEAIVKTIDEKTYYELEFDVDGSVSENTEPKYIKSDDYVSHGPPPVGTHVDVLWTDNKLWGAVFKGVNSQDIHHVEFEDGTVLMLKRDLVYRMTEDLPKKVASKICKASVMDSFPLAPETLNRSDESKRKCKRNSKYVNPDFVV